MSKNHEAVLSIYEAFGRGDVGAIVARLAEDVEWEYGGRAARVPWLRPGRGTGHAASFFMAAAEHLEFQEFRVNAVLDGGDTIVGLIDLVAIVKSTGKRIVERDEAHVWRFDSEGRVARFRHAADTAQHEEAAR